MKLRQTLAPAPFANWVEYFYDGELKVVGGETETDNQRYIEVLLSRGFSPINDEVVAPEVSDGASPSEPEAADEKPKTAKNKEAA